MSIPITIRDYTSKDVPVICQIIKEAFAEYQGVLKPPSSAEKKSPEVVKQELKTRRALVALNNEHLVGSVFYQQKEATVYIDRLAVLPSHRKQGIATQLMSEVELKARELYVSSLSLSVRLVLEEQQVFYKSLGFVFESYGMHAGFTEPTFMTMRKRF